ncbi:MAG: isoprenylcysteine carboxylmethyltransferase family protein [Chthoniobacteraceae bacterium]
MILSTMLIAAALFLPAWTWHWERAWVLLALAALGTPITMWLAFRHDPELLRERRRSPFQKDQPLADKLVLAPFLAAFYGQVVSIPLDVFRWHLLPPPGAAVSVLGLVLFAAGWTLITLVFRANTFAAPVVKHQKLREHRVIDTGVYAVVRHPMYTAVALMLPGMALWLGSTAGALLSLVPTGLLAVRILIEEDFLRRELAGYTEYMQRVRWRLVPRVW